MDRLVEFGAAATGISTTLLVVVFGFIALAPAARFSGPTLRNVFAVCAMLLGVVTPLTLGLFVSLSLTLEPHARDPLLHLVHLLSYIFLVVAMPLIVLGFVVSWRARKPKTWTIFLLFILDALGYAVWVLVLAPWIAILSLHLTSTTAKSDEFVSFVSTSLFSGLLYMVLLGTLLWVGTLRGKDRASETVPDGSKP